MWKVKNKKKQAKDEESKSWKSEVEGERKRVEINSKGICLDRLSGPVLCGKCFEVFFDSDVESVGNSRGFSFCVLASPPVVTVPSSDVSVVLRGCFFFSDSDSEFVEPQTFFSLQKTRSECGFGV